MNRILASFLEVGDYKTSFNNSTTGRFADFTNFLALTFLGLRCAPPQGFMPPAAPLTSETLPPHFQGVLYLRLRKAGRRAKTMTSESARSSRLKGKRLVS